MFHIMDNKTPEPPNKKDPRGLIKHDLDHLHSMFKGGVYSPKNTHDEIMYKEGQLSVLRYIESKMIAGRG